MKHATAVNIWGLSGFSVEILEDRARDRQDTGWSRRKAVFYFTKIIRTLYKRISITYKTEFLNILRLNQRRATKRFKSMIKYLAIN